MSIELEERLLTALQQGCLVELHRDPEDWSRCQVGYVDAVADGSVRIRSVTPQGDVLGYEVYALRVVVGVVLDDGKCDYLGKIARVVGKRSQIFQEVESWPKSGIRGALREALERQCVVTVGRTHADKESLCGLIRAMADDSVSIQLVDQYGEDDSLATVAIKGITAVHFGTEDEQLLDYLRASYASEDI